MHGRPTLELQAWEYTGNASLPKSCMHLGSTEAVHFSRKVLAVAESSPLEIDPHALQLNS